MHSRLAICSRLLANDPVEALPYNFSVMSLVCKTTAAIFVVIYTRCNVCSHFSGLSDIDLHSLNLKRLVIYIIPTIYTAAAPSASFSRVYPC